MKERDRLAGATWAPGDQTVEVFGFAFKHGSISAIDNVLHPNKLGGSYIELMD